MLTVPRICAVFAVFAISPSFAHGVSEHGTLIRDPPQPNQVADEVIPSSVPDAARDPARAVIDKLKLWKVGSKLSICFMSGSSSTLQNVIDVANTWTKYANLTFDFGPPGAPNQCSTGRPYQIKIGFKDSGYWSYVGTDSQRFTPSMNLEGLDLSSSNVSDQEFRRLVLHEFGHAIGLQHEHQSPEAKCSDEIDWPAAESYYSNCCNWSSSTTHANLETLVQSKRYRTTEYDPRSIMHYSLPVEIFKNGRQSRCYTAENYDLSNIDKTAASTLYNSQQFKQDALKENALGELKQALTEGGAKDAEVQQVVTNAAKTFDVTISQNNSAGRNINAPVFNGPVNQSSSGPCSPPVIGASDIKIEGCH
jgi:hypothetical protein